MAGLFTSSRINYFQVFQCIPEIMGMPFELRGNKWYAARYIDGKYCPRRDKLMVRMVDEDGIQIIEQGGPAMSLWAWMQEYGGCSGPKEAKQRLLAITPAKYVVTDTIDAKVEYKYVPKEFLEKSYERRLHVKDPLSMFLHSLFGDTRAEFVLKMYKVGCETRTWRDKDGNLQRNTLTTFWFIDSEGNVCHDKLMLYKPDGHRDHAYGGNRHMRLRDGYGFRCLFGAHLLAGKQPEDKVYVVESEKTAIIARLFYGKGIWLASGGLNNLKKKHTGGDWVLLPDKDAFDEWSEKFPGQCVKWWESFEGYEPGPKDDIADYILSRR